MAATSSIGTVSFVDLWRRSRAGQGRARIVLGIRILAASVWLVFGIGFKVLGAVPRHAAIVSSVLGEEIGPPATVIVGVLEAGLGIWVLTGSYPRLCAAAQTLAIGGMNALELRLARHLLLAPVPMLIANVVFVSLVWLGATLGVAREDR